MADLVLISLGVGGLSALISTSSVFQTVISVGGVLFLLWCGVRSLLSAYRAGSSTHHLTAPSATLGIQATIVAALSFSFLNPSAYVDTLVIIGSKSLNFPIDDRLIFGIGAVSASTCWFFALTYGASKLSSTFRSQTVWRTLDLFSGCVMLFIAGTMFATTLL